MISSQQPPAQGHFRAIQRFVGLYVVLLPFRRGPRLTPAVGSVGIEGQGFMPTKDTFGLSFRLTWLVHLLIRKQSLNALGLLQEMPF